MTAMRFFSVILTACILSGCVSIDIGNTNATENVTTPSSKVAVITAR